MKTDLVIRKAAPEDLDLLFTLIGEFAAYEHNEAMFTATKETFRENLFEKGCGEAYILEDGGGVQGHMVLAHFFTPYLGKNTLLLEMLYLRDSARGKGYGRKVFEFLAKLCAERDYPRLEWFCLRTNDLGNGFYRAMGFSPSERLYLYRAGDEQMDELRRA